MRIRYVSRGVLFFLAICIIVYLNRKTDDNVDSIAEFKFKMYQKLQTDSLNSMQKADILLKETTKFVDDSSRLQKGTRYLMALLGLVIITELGFLIMAKRNSGRLP